MTELGNHADKTATMLLQAFSSRFAIGLSSTTVKLPLHPVAGQIVGMLSSAGGFWVGQRTQLSRLKSPNRSLSWIHVVFFFPSH